MSATAGLGVFGSGGAFVGAVAGVGTRDRIIGKRRRRPRLSQRQRRRRPCFPSGSSILVGIAAFVVAMAFAWRHARIRQTRPLTRQHLPTKPFILAVHCNLCRKAKRRTKTC